MPKLTIIILSFNTRKITQDSLEKLASSLKPAPFSSELLIVDNASSDGSPDMISAFSKKYTSSKISIKVLLNKENLGFPKGNNQALRQAKGEYILFLNSDVIIDSIDWEDIITFVDAQSDVGALTVRVVLPSGKIDPASHRGFPTVWNSFCYYSGLEKFSNVVPLLKPIFGGYHLTHLDMNTIHEIDSPSGAFYLSRKKLLDTLGGFDETFFMYGEDLDLSYRIRQAGYRILYYPKSTVTHLKYQSGLHNEAQRKKTKKYFYDAMRIFYRKHYERTHPSFINSLVYLAISIKSHI